MRNKPDSLSRLQAAGFDYEDACALRRISMTLHRWHELECGGQDSWSSFCITRGMKRNGFSGRAGTGDFIHDENGKPYIERHPLHDRNGKTTYTPIPDRERGALKRLEAIIKRYPGFGYYVQGDPRGCALSIMRPGDVPAGESVDAFYTRGIAVYK